MKSIKSLSLLAATLSIPLTLSGLQAQTAPTKAMPKNSPTAGATSTVIPLKDPVAIVDGVKISKADLEKAFKEAVAGSGMPSAEACGFKIS